MTGTFPFLKTALTAALACTVLTLGAPPAAALPQTVFDGSKARVNLANKLLMLTQMIGSAGCRIDAGIGTEDALRDLQAARTDFNAILDGLENGAAALGVPTREAHSAVLKSLASVRGIWTPVDGASARLLEAGSADPAAAAAIAEANLPLLEAATILASDISGKYTNPHELTQADAMAIFIAGRLRMISHRIAKEACGVATGAPVLGTPEALRASLDLYAASLGALRNGMPEAGVNRPPNARIASELEGLDTAWQASMAAVDTARGGSGPTRESVAEVAAATSDLVTQANNIVTLYMLATAGQHDVYQVPVLAYAESELARWLENRALVEAVRAQNAAHRDLSQAEIDQLDLDWRAQRKTDERPLIADLLSRPVSLWLREMQTATSDLVTEVFAMDDRGLNVAQSVETSDYWQGDESKWQETVGNRSGRIHISEMEYDESTGRYQSQVSMPVRDPETGALIGAVTFGIDIQSLL